jgi:hypothetical protein
VILSVFSGFVDRRIRCETISRKDAATFLPEPLCGESSALEANGMFTMLKICQSPQS